VVAHGEPLMNTTDRNVFRGAGQRDDTHQNLPAFERTS
jgi:hypothetical protein